jgi:hypothetical protein
MKDTDKLRLLIREEIKKEINEGAAGAIIGYLAGVLADLFLKNKNGKSTKKSAETLEKEYAERLEKKYQSDPKFREMVDAIQAGRRYKV